jgi:hypothetical protein
MEKQEFKDKLTDVLNSQLGKDVKLLMAYTVGKTKTEKDDEFVKNAADYSDVIADTLVNISELKPTEKEAMKAAVRILELISEETKTKWDDLLVSVLKRIA